MTKQFAGWAGDDFCDRLSFPDAVVTPKMVEQWDSVLLAQWMRGKFPDGATHLAMQRRLEADDSIPGLAYGLSWNEYMRQTEGKPTELPSWERN